MYPVLNYNGSPIVDYQGHPVFWGGVSSQYTPLEYLESTGTQYIDLDYILNYDTELDFEFAYTSNTGIQGNFGYRGNSSASGNIYYFVNNSGLCVVRLGTGNDGSTGKYFDLNTFYRFQIKNHEFYFDNERIGDRFTVSSTETFGAPRIFGVSGIQLSSSGRLRYLRILENNTLLFDLIPVLDANGIPCLYDRVNNKFYYNQGTGEFSYKKWNKTDLSYIQLDGTSYIDTGYKPNQNTSFKIKYEINELNDTETVTCPYGTVGSITSINVDGGILRTLDGTSSLNRVGWGTGSGSNRNITGYNSLNTIYEDYYDTNIVYINGTNIITLPNTQDWTSKQSLIINGRHNADGTVVFAPNSAKYYSASASENGVSMLELTPCTDENNTPCMYDSVRNKIIYPQTIGA